MSTQHLYILVKDLLEYAGWFDPVVHVPFKMVFIYTIPSGFGGFIFFFHKITHTAFITENMTAFT